MQNEVHMHHTHMQTHTHTQTSTGSGACRAIVSFIFFIDFIDFIVFIVVIVFVVISTQADRHRNKHTGTDLTHQDGMSVAELMIHIDLPILLRSI